jgi:transposase
MQKFRVPASRNQVSLLPKSVDEYVGERDPVRFVDSLVDEFEIGEIESAYSHIGRPGYSPRVLIKILLYGKIRGIRSSRELSRGCKENLRFIFLAQEEKPDFRTISDFRKRFLVQLAELLKQTVEIGLEEGLISLEHVAIDGTKVRANAGANSFKTPEAMAKILEELEKSFKDDIARDEAAEVEEGNDHDDDPKLPEEFADKKKLAERLKTLLKQAKDKDRISGTDPDASFMKGRQGCHPSYNGQFAVDAKSRMVVGARITDAGSDHGELKPMLEEIEKTTGKNPKKVSADKGYRATSGLVELEKRGIEGFVPLQESHKNKISSKHFKYDDKEDEYTCPAGQVLVQIATKKDRQADVYESEDCTGCEMAKSCLSDPSRNRTLLVSWHESILATMRERVESEEGQIIRKARASTVEPVFGWLKFNRKFQQIIVRGKKAANHIWKFEAAALNVSQIIKFRAAAAT